MENRSFDQYFGTYPGADGIPMNEREADGVPTATATTGPGRLRYPYHDTNYIDQGGPHGHKASMMSYDDGKMDGFITALDAQGNGCMLHPTTRPCPQATHGPQGQPDIMGYKTRREIPNYWDYADHYTLFDHMFAPVDSWTLPSHLYLVSGWSAFCPTCTDPMCCQLRARVPRRRQHSTTSGRARPGAPRRRTSTRAPTSGRRSRGSCTSAA